MTVGGMALALLLSSQAFAVTTFTGTRNTGTRTATYSITTDDTIGAIGTGQITSWTMSITDGPVTDSFSNLNGIMEFSGQSLWSTGTDLLFDYDNSVGFIYASFYNFSHRSALVMQAGDGYHEDLFRLDGFGTDFEHGPQTGLQSIASVPISAVPEPATWAMMLLGFGGIGLATRRNKRRSRALMQAA